MSNEVYRVDSEWQKKAWINKDRRLQILHESESNPEGFWAEQAQRIDWFTPFQVVKNVSYHRPVHIEWYKGGELNVSTNCIDRHLNKNPDKIAFIWVPEDTTKPDVRITYHDLHNHVSRLANVLKSYGVKRGDRVTIYMPMILEAVYAMLACTRIGAIHSVVFGGFSPTSLADRIRDCESDFIITAEEGVRGGKTVPLKANVDAALKLVNGVRNVLVVKNTTLESATKTVSTETKMNWVSERDIHYQEAMAKASPNCAAEKMHSEDPLFILYTSGSTGKPKGVLHTTAGYLVYASLTHEMVFDYHPNDIYWCAADIGWVTGHSYIVYGPLANGATSILYEGLPTYPTPARIWQIIDKYQVNTLYTAPTLIRALMREGTSWVESTSRKSLRLLGSVGEPINPEAWHWYHTEVGNKRCPIVDTWWQTETGGIVISPLPGATDLKPGSATYPLFGVQPILLNDRGEEIVGEGLGHLCLSQSWPGQMRTVYKDHQRFEDMYFSQFPGRYYTGDECRRDADGYYWILGRADDVINVSGHRLGTAEVESALISHHAVAESAVVGYPHDIKGQGIYAFVTLKNGIDPSPQLQQQLIQQVRKEIGAIASPDFIQWAPGLPKTRSGKIMRRILKKIAANDTHELGDTSTLADPSVVENLIAGRNK